MDRNKGGARERRKGGRKATRGAGAVGAPRAQGNRRQKAMPLGRRQGLRSPPPAVTIHPSAPARKSNRLPPVPWPFRSRWRGAPCGCVLSHRSLSPTYLVWRGSNLEVSFG